MLIRKSRGSLADGAHRFDGIDDQVQHYLLELDSISVDERHILGKFGLQRDAIPQQLAGGQGDDFEDGFVDVQLILPRRHLLDERADLANDLAGSIAAPGRWPQATAGPSPDRAVARKDQCKAASALVTTAVIGWLTSWAIEAVSCPMVVTRLTRAISVWASRKASAACLLSVISWIVPNMRWGRPDSSLITSPWLWTMRTLAVGPGHAVLHIVSRAATQRFRNRFGLPPVDPPDG